MECCLCCPFCFTTFSALFTLGKSCPLCFNLTRDSLRVGGNFSSYLSHSLKLTTERSGRRAVCKNASLPLIKRISCSPPPNWWGTTQSCSQSGQNLRNEEANDIFKVVVTAVIQPIIKNANLEIKNAFSNHKDIVQTKDFITNVCSRHTRRRKKWKLILVQFSKWLKSWNWTSALSLGSIFPHQNWAFRLV